MKHYDLTYLQHCGKTSSLQGIKEAGNTYGYIPMKQRRHWSWKYSEVANKHKLYRHINVPLPKANALMPCSTVTGSIATVKNVKQSHNDPLCQNVPTFYERNFRRNGGKVRQFVPPSSKVALPKESSIDMINKLLLELA